MATTKTYRYTINKLSNKIKIYKRTFEGPKRKMRKETQTEKINKIKLRVEDIKNLSNMILLDIHKLTKETEKKIE